MSNTPNAALALMAQSEKSKYVKFNEVMRRLDAIFNQPNSRVLGRDNTPPVSPTDGMLYIVTATATGDWVGQENNIAYYNSNAWVFFTPAIGWSMFVTDEFTHLLFDGAAWIQKPIAGSPSKATVQMYVLEEELTGMMGASVNTTIQIPSNSIVFNVGMRVTDAITGASSFKVGISGEDNKFGDSLGIAEGSTNFGIIGPTGFYSDTPILITANGGVFSGGDIKISIHYYHPQIPQS